MMAASMIVPPRPTPHSNIPPLGVDFNNITSIPPIPGTLVAGPGQGMTKDREAQLLRNIKELEEEVRLLKVDNEKQVCYL